jgi:hypothetical protein
MGKTEGNYCTQDLSNSCKRNHQGQWFSLKNSGMENAVTGILGFKTIYSHIPIYCEGYFFMHLHYKVLTTDQWYTIYLHEITVHLLELSKCRYFIMNLPISLLVCPTY